MLHQYWLRTPTKCHLIFASRFGPLRHDLARQNRMRWVSSGSNTIRIADAFGRAAIIYSPSCKESLLRACREFILAHQELSPKLRSQWWAQQALREQQLQMEVLGRVIPRSGGRLAPQLLDNLVPRTSPHSEIAWRNIVACLGMRSGLTEVLRLRAAVREAGVLIGTRTSAGFALERMDRQLQNLLSLWLNPGFTNVEVLHSQSPPEAWDAANHSSSLMEKHAVRSWNHRCFILCSPANQEPKPTSFAPILLCAHASLLPSLPENLKDVIAQPVEGVDASVACFWAIGSPLSGECLRGLGLGKELLHQANERLRAELSQAQSCSGTPAVCVLAPLRGFTSWLRERKAWDLFGNEQPPLALALQRALEGFQNTKSEDVQFVDSDGDSVCFRFVPNQGLEVAVGTGSFQRVLRLRIVEDTRTVLFLMGGPQEQALQVEVPEKVANRGDLNTVARMGESSGLLPMGLREPLLRLGQEYLLRRVADSKRVADPIAHFHFSSGAAIDTLLWRADDSFRGCAESLGIMVRFVYDGINEAKRAEAYVGHGIVAHQHTA